VLVSASTERALDYIAQRASDVQRAYAPGAVPAFDDVANARSAVSKNVDPLSIALPNDAYLITRDAPSDPLYTRDGGLQVRDGLLVTQRGSPVLGYASAENAPVGDLAIDPVDRALGRVQNLRIEADGTFAYDRTVVDPRSGTREMQRIAVGRLALARFPAATKLGIVDATRASAPAGVVPHVGRPGDGNFDRVVPMRREGSHIDIDRSLEKLKDAYTAFDALAAAHKAQSKLGKTAMDLLK